MYFSVSAGNPVFMFPTKNEFLGFFLGKYSFAVLMGNMFLAGKWVFRFW